MQLRTIFLVSALVLLGAASAVGQSCPAITTVGPYDFVKPGAPLVFTASVRGGDAKVVPNFNWTISTGVITSGQGTSSITVDTSGVEGTITATVEVGGYGRNCSTTSSFSADIEKRPAARQVDEFGGVIPSEIDGKLDNFFIELTNDPTATGYVIAYPMRSAPAAAGAFLKRVVSDARIRGVDLARVKTIEGGMRDLLLIQLWIVPQGAPIPKADPPKTAPRKPAATKKPA